MFSKILLVVGVSMISSAFAECNLNGQWADKCQDPEMIEMTDDIKNALTKIHNERRNNIALGNVEHYDQAANMETIQWDDGLAAKAALNVHQCEMKHDECRGTDQFPGAGQNLAMAFTTGDPARSPEQIAGMTDGWYNEQTSGGQYGWMDMIKKFETVGDGDHVVGHFTQMIWAKANRIGCAVSAFQDGQWKSTLLACNYANGNLIGAEVYQPGDAASQCSNGKNDQYPGLCKPN